MVQSRSAVMCAWLRLRRFRAHHSRRALVRSRHTTARPRAGRWAYRRPSSADSVAGSVSGSEESNLGRAGIEDRAGTVARSVAIILDGNARWAEQRGLPTAEGHRAGTQALRRTVEAAIDLGVESLAVYAFSTENWARPPEEVDDLMEIFSETFDPDRIDADALAAHLYAPEMADPDLVIRTSGERRISNFLLWQVAYAELLFVETLWPDFGVDDLREALDEYAQRRRRFGGR